MKNMFIFFLFVLAFVQCNNDEQPERCSTPATVRDLTGLDGCGWVFELENGTRLLPLRVFRCGTPPVSKEANEDPLLDFVFEDGKKVFISYQETPTPNICMAGPVVTITCISEAVSISEE